MTPEPATLTLFAIAGRGLAGYSLGVTPRKARCRSRVACGHLVALSARPAGVAMGPRGAIPLNLALMEAELFDQQHENAGGSRIGTSPTPRGWLAEMCD